MELSITPEIIISWFSEIFRVEPEVQKNTYRFNLRGSGKTAVEVSEEALCKILSTLASMNIYNETAIYADKFYEIFVREESSHRLSRLRGEQINLSDDDNEIVYDLSKASDEYLIYTMYKLSQDASLRLVYDPMSVRRLYDFNNIEKADNINIFDFLRNTFLRLLTLKMRSTRNRSISEFTKFGDAFLFQFSFNADTAIVPQRYFDELIRRGRITRLRRARIDEIDAPKRHYISDLIYHDQMGVASDSPPLEFLSYYHVLEHFFESVYNDALIDRVRNMMTQPGFSYKRKKDITKLINEVGKSIKFRNETMVYNEHEALRLTLEKYVNVTELKNRINEYDPTLIEYYRTNRVSFSNGAQLDLDTADASNAFTKLADRIYHTRNSIVHSKESEKGRYVPFDHDKILIKEVPLLRFTAEEIIINTSTLIQ